MFAMPDLRQYTLRQKVAGAIAIVFSLFQMVVLYTAALDPFRLRVSHILFALVLVYLLFPAKRLGKAGVVLDTLLIICSMAPAIYLLARFQRFSLRMPYVSRLYSYEFLLAILFIIALLEATRRTIGLTLPIIAVCGLAYAFLGKGLPGGFGHSGFTPGEIFDQVFFTTEGIFGIPLGSSATIVILFIIFGAFLEQSGIAQYFMDLSCALTVKSRGGPAKMAVFSSALFGSISGSAIANVATTGQITIPLMKKTGYRPEFAGAVEAVASTGGQIMPPVMGAAVFIMSDFTGIPYIQIVKHALLPAILYYLSVFVMVHFEALKNDIPMADPGNLPSKKQLLLDSYLLIPLVAIVVVLLGGFSPTLSCMASIGLVLVISSFKKSTRMGPVKIATALINGAKGTLAVAMACGTAGILVGVINYCGVGFKFTNSMLSLGQDKMLLALILTAIATMILGMGLPTTPAYVVVAALMVPTLRQMGVLLISAHLFAFYFANIANITPPVALASYTAAGIAKSEPFKTGILAFMLGIAAYIVPFMFVYSPSLLLVGDSIPQLALAIFTSIFGVTLLAAGCQGWLICRAGWLERLLLFAAALVLIYPGIFTDLVGMGLAAVVIGVQLAKKRAKNGALAQQ